MNFLNDIKILLLGPSGVGKTTLKRIFFEQSNPIQLLKESLEPTVDIVTNRYDIGRIVAIHDLAGQQIDYWLSDSPQLFYETDLILCILDSSKGWEENKQIWQKIDENRINLCPNCHLVILFHKIDLIDNNQKKELNLKIERSFYKRIDTTALLTSIKENHIFDTFQAFISILRKSLVQLKNQKFNDMIGTVDILNRFIKKNHVNIYDLPFSSGKFSSPTKRVLKNLKKKGFLQIDKEKNYIQLSPKGFSLIKNLKQNIKDIIEKGAKLQEKKESIIPSATLDSLKWFNKKETLNFSSILSVGSLGGVGAAKILSNLVGNEILITSPEIIKFPDLIKLFNELDTIVVLTQEILGNIETEAVLIFPYEFALIIIDTILNNERNQYEEVKELSANEETIIKEIGTLMIEEYINAISNYLNIKIEQTDIKVFMRDYQDSISPSELEGVMIIQTPLKLKILDVIFCYLFLITKNIKIKNTFNKFSNSHEISNY